MTYAESLIVHEFFEEFLAVGKENPLAGALLAWEHSQYLHRRLQQSDAPEEILKPAWTTAFHKGQLLLALIEESGEPPILAITKARYDIALFVVLVCSRKALDAPTVAESEELLGRTAYAACSEAVTPFSHREEWRAEILRNAVAAKLKIAELKAQTN